MVGIRSKILKDVPPYMLVDGDPARARGLNVIGLQRNAVDPETIAIFKKVYRLLYHSDQNLNSTIQFIEQEFQGYPEIEYLINFIKNSKKGIVNTMNKNSITPLVTIS